MNEFIHCKPPNHIPITTQLLLPTLLLPTLLLPTLLLLLALLLLTAHAAAGLLTPRRCCSARLRLSLARPGSFARHVWSIDARAARMQTGGRAGKRTRAASQSERAGKQTS
jgi:hypothetical protein